MIKGAPRSADELDVPAFRRSPRSAKVPATAATLLVALLALPAAARAEPEWRLPPQQLSSTLTTPQSWAPPAVAVGNGGGATALMVHWQSPGSTLVSVDRPAGGTWGAVSTVPSGTEPIEPELASAADGEQTAAWLDIESGETQFRVWVSRRRAGESWQSSSQMPLYAPEDHVASVPAVAEDATGDAVVVWVEANSSYNSEWLAASEYRDGAWSAPQQISAPAGFVQISSERSLASDGPGEFVVGWTGEASLPGTYVAEAETLRAGSWSGEQVVESSPDTLDGLSLDANAEGQAGMTWADTSTETVHAASMSNGAWTVSDPASTHIHVVCEQGLPQVGIDAAGTILALWQESTGRLTSERMSPAGGWLDDRETLVALPEKSVYGMQLRVDDEGDALASWTAIQTESPWSSSVQVDSELAGRSWVPPLTLSSGADGYRSGTTLGFGREGFGVAAWLDELSSPEGGEDFVFTPRSVAFEGTKAHPPRPVAPTSTSVSAPAVSGGSPPHRLGPVYVLVPHRRLWLARRGRKVTQRIRNSNPFLVSGTATIYEYFPGRAAHASRRVATTVRFALAAGQTAPISFRIGSRALRRLRSYVPDRGHILVSIHLSIRGGGQAATSSVVMALDQPQHLRRHHAHSPRIPRGYPAPVDPWARKSC